MYILIKEKQNYGQITFLYDIKKRFIFNSNDTSDESKSYEDATFEV